MFDAVNGGRQPAPAPTNGSSSKSTAGFGTLHIGRQRPRAKKYQPRRRHFRHGLCAAAVRAITAAKLYLAGETTLTEAAFKCGSNVPLRSGPPSCC